MSIDKNSAAVTDERPEPEGMEAEAASWGDYPLDDMLIRSTHL